jgi:hypothetical protein
MNRPTFKTVYDQDIRAGGILFYKIDNNKVKLLLQYIKNKNNIKSFYEDIGGKTDYGDETIYETIYRELVEETNGIINDKKYVHNYEHSIYSPEGKYLLLIVKADDHIINTKLEDYGTMENKDSVKRIFHWVNYYRLYKYHDKPQIKLSTRLDIIRNKIYDYIINIII